MEMQGQQKKGEVIQITKFLNSSLVYVVDLYRERRLASSDLKMTVIVNNFRKKSKFAPFEVEQDKIQR